MPSKLSFTEQFQQIDSLLRKTRSYWQIRPFEHLQFPWPENSALCHYASGLSSGQIEKLDVDDKRLRQVISPLIGTNLDIIEPLPCLNSLKVDAPTWLKAGIKGRKLQQIESFCALTLDTKSPVLEWCAGKGHLGRLIAFTQQRSVTSVEWQQQLCADGELLSLKHKLNQRFRPGDVLSDEVDGLLQSKQHAIALHACGDLHIALLTKAVLAKTQRITIAPCCYHLIDGQDYQKLSQQAQSSELQLQRSDLSLSMQQTVVAGQRQQRHRATEVAWRLAFDLLQRDIRQQNHYLPLPSIRQSMLVGTFDDFCQWACDKKGLVLVDKSILDHYQQRGWQRRELNSRIELVTHAFRQLLERWLLLDRILFLEQHGYRVNLSEFCAHEITPRNAFIDATLCSIH